MIDTKMLYSSKSNAISEWRNWSVVLASLAGITLLAVHGYSLGVVMGPISSQFGWSRAAISAGLLIISGIGLLVSPCVGTAIDYYGPRRIATVGVFVYCAALAFMATAGPSLASWLLRCGFLAAGACLITPAVWTAAITRLFHRNRGKALAFAMCGTGLGATIVPLIASSLVVHFGWRGAYIGLAALGAVFIIPTVLFAFKEESVLANDVTLSPGNEDLDILPGLDRSEGFRSPVFLKILIAVLLFGISSLSLTINAVPVLLSQGFILPTAARVASLIGVGSICGRLCGGLLLDRFDAKLVAAFASACPVFTVAMFTLFPGSIWPVAAGAITLGLSLGAEVDACAFLAARYFGLRSFGALFGTINGVVAFGTGIAPILANYVFDMTGTYNYILIGIIPTNIISVALFLNLGHAPVFSSNINECLALDDHLPPLPYTV